MVWGFRRLTLSVVASKTDNVRTLYHWRKTSNYVAFLVVVMVVGRIWFEGIASFSTFLGLVSAGVAIALKDPLVNIAGWAFIIWWKPFEVEDRIQIGEFRGDVIDIQTTQFTIMEVGNWVDAEQSTGRILHVPNGLVFTRVLANYTKGFPYVWDEMGVLLTFESDWRKAKSILKEIIEKHTEEITTAARDKIRKAAQKHMIFFRVLTPIVYTSVADSGVMLSLRYLCYPKRRRGMKEKIWEDILDAFAEHKDIDFAYPTTRFFDSITEGKQAP